MVVGNVRADVLDGAPHTAKVRQKSIQCSELPVASKIPENLFTC
jgi:hypothetical protein